MKLLKREIKQIAVMHTAAVILSTDLFAFPDKCEITQEDQQEILDHMKKIAGKILNDLPVLGSMNQIIDYVLYEPETRTKN